MACVLDSARSFKEQNKEPGLTVEPTLTGGNDLAGKNLHHKKSPAL